MNCTCGAEGLPPGRHENVCALRIGDVQARQEAAEVAAAGGWEACMVRIRAAAASPDVRASAWATFVCGYLLVALGIAGWIGGAS